MAGLVKGGAPDRDLPGEAYLIKKLEETRKDCQWLLGLGAAGVLGVVMKDGFGSALPALRGATAVLSGLQILIAMSGAMSWLTRNVDPAEYKQKLERRLMMRYFVRNASVVLLAITFLLIALLAWSVPPAS